MLSLNPHNKNSEDALHAVEPSNLSHQPLPLDTRDKVVRVEFNHRWRQTIIIIVTAMCALLLGWSWFTEIDDIAQAPGRLIPDSAVQPIKVPFDSKVESVTAIEGKHVKKGDLLLTLDPINSTAELENDKQQLAIAQRELKRHEHAHRVISDYLKDPSRLPADLSGVSDVAQTMVQLYSAIQELHRAEADMKTASATEYNAPEMSSLTQQQKSYVDKKKFKEDALTSRTEQFASQERELVEKTATLKSQVEMQKLAVEQLKETLQGAQQQLAAYEQVFKTGASSKTECLNARIKVEDKHRQLLAGEGQYRQLQGDLVTTEHELDELTASHQMSQSRMKAELKDIAASGINVNMKMREAERASLDARTAQRVGVRAAQSAEANERSEINIHGEEVDKLQAEIEAQQRIVNHYQIKAPTDGLVALMHVQGPGQVVQRGEDLMTIVPAGEALRAEIFVPNEDVPFLHVGEKVKLQFPAYPYQQYGTVAGVVQRIDAFPCNDKAHSSSYRTMVKLERTWIVCRGQKIMLKKGLTTQADLVLRKRQLLVMQLAELLKLRYVHFKS